MNLSRSRDGTMIHRRDCKFAVDMLTWGWAESKSLHDIIRVCEYFGYETCLACKPLGNNILRNLPRRFKI